MWLVELHASHQVTLLLLGEMEKSSSCAGIKGTDAFFFGPVLGGALPSSGETSPARAGEADLVQERRWLQGGGNCKVVSSLCSVSF